MIRSDMPDSDATNLPSSTRLRANILRVVFDNAVDAQCVVDPIKDAFVAVNPALCELTGYSSEELLARDFATLSLVHPEDQSTLARARERIADREGLSLRFRLVKRTGVVRWIEARSRHVDSFGTRLIVGSVRDITDQVNLERQLRTKLEVDSQRFTQLEARNRSVMRSNQNLFQMVRVLEAFPKFTNMLAGLSSIDEVVKQACLAVTNRDKGLGYDRCAIWLRDGDGLELGYANPFRITTKLPKSEMPGGFQDLLDGKEPEFTTALTPNAVPISAQGKVIGILEVGTLRQGELMERDDPTRTAHASLVRSLAAFIGIQIANLRLLQRVQQQVVEDELTGLRNRRYFLEKLETEYRRAGRYNRALSLLVIDIDNFKVVNDTHSHLQGDLVLRAISDVLSKSFRELDSVCRIGGEELAVIMPETKLSDALKKAEAIRAIVEQLKIPLTASMIESAREDTMQITISIGVASVGKQVLDWEQLFQEADRALYDAKNAGKNRVVSKSPPSARTGAVASVAV